jgi:hypothetical protein
MNGFVIGNGPNLRQFLQFSLMIASIHSLI